MDEAFYHVYYDAPFPLPPPNWPGGRQTPTLHTRLISRTTTNTTSLPPNPIVTTYILLTPLPLHLLLPLLLLWLLQRLLLILQLITFTTYRKITWSEMN